VFFWKAALLSYVSWIGFLMPECTNAQEAHRHTVLTIEFGPEDGPSNTKVRMALDAAFQGETELKVDHYVEFLRSDRFGEQVASTALRDYIRSKYLGRDIDVVIAENTVVTRFVLQNHRELFPDAAIVFAAVTEPDASLRAGATEVTGLTLGDVFSGTIREALHLFPATRNVYLIAQTPDAGLTALYRAAVRETLVDLPHGIAVDFLSAADLPELADRVRSLPSHSLIIFAEFISIGESRYLLPAPWPERVVAEAANVPVFGVQDRHIGSGVVGGYVRDPALEGMELGKIAIQILLGGQASTIPVRPFRPSFVFDWRALQRFEVDEAELPEGAEVRYREPGFWELYYLQVLGALCIIALQSALIVALTVQSRARRVAETAVRRQEARLRERYEEVRMLARRLITSQEEERARIAREIHDDIGQRLASISITLSGLRQRLSDSTGVGPPEIDGLKLEARRLAEDLRDFSHRLHPSGIEHVGLHAALSVRCREVFGPLGIRYRIKVGADWHSLSDVATIALFRIAQEAFQNVIAHANATEVAISLDRGEGRLTMTVMDNGVGVRAQPEQVGGLGLVSMRERAELLGGEFRIEPIGGGGTIVTVSLPVPVSE
jgi:signal transduction histidine kinase